MENIAKMIDDIFGYNYGSGEKYIIPELRKLINLCPNNGTYDYREFESCFGGLAAWLFINILCGKDVIEYGTSPRFGWLTDKGRELKTTINAMTDDEIVESIDNWLSFD